MGIGIKIMKRWIKTVSPQVKSIPALCTVTDKYNKKNPKRSSYGV